MKSSHMISVITNGQWWKAFWVWWRELVSVLKHYLVNITLHCHGAYLYCLDYKRHQSLIEVDNNVLSAIKKKLSSSLISPLLQILMARPCQILHIRCHKKLHQVRIPVLNCHSSSQWLATHPKLICWSTNPPPIPVSFIRIFSTF